MGNKITIRKLRRTIEDAAAYKALKKLLPTKRYYSRDWRHGGIEERIEWLLGMYESSKTEVYGLLDHAEEMATALKVIHTWASFRQGSELHPQHVIDLCDKALGKCHETQESDTTNTTQEDEEQGA